MKDITRAGSFSFSKGESKEIPTDVILLQNIWIYSTSQMWKAFYI